MEVLDATRLLFVVVVADAAWKRKVVHCHCCGDWWCEWVASLWSVVTRKDPKK